jgi:hypothetical protein
MSRAFNIYIYIICIQAVDGQEAAPAEVAWSIPLGDREQEWDVARAEAMAAREEARLEVEAGKVQSREMLKKAVEAKKLLQGKLFELTAENEKLKQQVEARQVCVEDDRKGGGAGTGGCTGGHEEAWLEVNILKEKLDESQAQAMRARAHTHMTDTHARAPTAHTYVMMIGTHTHTCRWCELGHTYLCMLYVCTYEIPHEPLYQPARMSLIPPSRTLRADIIINMHASRLI